MLEPEVAGEQPTDSSDQTSALEELSAQREAELEAQLEAQLEAERQEILEAERQEIERLKQEKRDREEKEAERRKPNPFAAQRAKEVCLTQRLHSFHKSKYHRVENDEPEPTAASKQEETTLREALVRVSLSLSLSVPLSLSLSLSVSLSLSLSQPLSLAGARRRFSRARDEDAHRQRWPGDGQEAAKQRQLLERAGRGGSVRVGGVPTVRALHFPLSHSFSHTNLKSPCAEQGRIVRCVR